MASELPRSASPEGAKVYFIQPQDGEVITGPNVKVVFGLSGMGIAPAGIEKSNTGHHHLLIDVDNLPMGMPIPSDARHLHFGGGQTEAVIELAPGEHQLQLVLADHLHIPHDPPVVSDVIKITVE
ncbi:MAG: DUF4399 domain-containing protein [Pseudomonadota bacterium]